MKTLLTALICIVMRCTSASRFPYCSQTEPTAYPACCDEEKLKVCYTNLVKDWEGKREYADELDFDRENRLCPVTVGKFLQQCVSPACKHEVPKNLDIKNGVLRAEYGLFSDSGHGHVDPGTGYYKHETVVVVDMIAEMKKLDCNPPQQEIFGKAEKYDIDESVVEFYDQYDDYYDSEYYRG